MPNIMCKVFSGTHHEIGVQQGKAVRGLIHRLLDTAPDFEAIRLMKPRLLPTFAFLALAKRRAAKLLRNDIFESYPRQAERIKGLVEGAEIDMPTALFLQSMELLIGKPSFRVQACTTVALSSKRTSTNETIVAKNFDYLTGLESYQLTCQSEPTGRFRTLGCTMAPLTGVADGMNEHGLTVTYNLAYTTEKPQCYAPLSLALQEMLETCRNVDEAARFISEARQGGHDALLTLADAQGNMEAVEITPNHSATRRPVGRQMINTNHYQTVEMQQYEIPRDAVYFGKVPKSMAGVRVHESSERRLKRAEELLKGWNKVDEDKITVVLHDHGPESKPSAFTICRHDPYASTLRSVIFYPESRKMKVLYGNPCQNEYEEIKFS